jgi:bifunctional pyridoxal-dependent enzyme with beta-cystathionase and maltose regulon repressor activities
MTTHNYLADRTHKIEWSGIRIMFALADEIPDVVNLGIGQPDFDTPEFIRDAAKQALDEGYTRYPPAKGFADLRRAIAVKLKAENDFGMRLLFLWASLSASAQQERSLSHSNSIRFKKILPIPLYSRF